MSVIRERHYVHPVFSKSNIPDSAVSRLCAQFFYDINSVHCLNVCFYHKYSYMKHLFHYRKHKYMLDELTP